MKILNIVINSSIQNMQNCQFCVIINSFQTQIIFLNFRTLLSTLLVVQNNPIIQTQGDRLVRVGCVLDDSGKQEFLTPNDATLHGAVTFEDNQ